MALVVGENSYVSVEDADAFFADLYFPEALPWLQSDTPAKEQALTTATLRIDALQLIGAKVDPLQTLEFPRAYSSWVEDEPAVVPQANVPIRIKHAVYHEALALLAGIDDGYRIRLQREGVSQARQLDASETYTGAGASRAPLRSSHAADLLSRYVRSAAALG